MTICGRFLLIGALVCAPVPIAAQPSAAQSAVQTPPGPPAPAPVTADPMGPPVPITAQPRCSDQPAANGDIVVCGRRPDENSSFRIPRAFRGQVSHDDADASLAARTRDMDSLEQYSSQTVGGGGYLQRSREDYCRWLAERQAAQGRRPDCTRHNRQDTPEDYTRGIPPARE